MTGLIDTLCNLISMLTSKLPNPSTDDTLAAFKEWRGAVQAQMRLKEMKANAITAREEDRERLVECYVKYCLPTSNEFITKILSVQPGSARVVGPWDRMTAGERRVFIEQVRRRVEETCGLPLPPPQQQPVSQYRTIEFLPPVVARAPRQPYHPRTAPSYRSHPMQPQIAASAPQFQSSGNGYSTAMPQSVNPGYGSQHFQNHTTMHGNPAGYGYNSSSSSVNPSASFAPAFSTGQQYQPPPPTHFQHPAHARTIPASSAAPLLYSLADAEVQQLLYADLPLVQACQRLILAADTAGISKPEEKEWFGKVRAAEGQVPHAERSKLAHLVQVGTSAIHEIVDDCIKGHVRSELVHGLAQEAMNRCLAAIEQVAHFHAGQTGQALCSLGSSSLSSHPFDRLSLRQRVIYPRAFTSFSG